MPVRDEEPVSEMDGQDRARLKVLRAALQAGEDSGVAEGDVFEEVRSYIRQLSAEMHRN